MIAWIVAAVVALCFLSAVGVYVFWGRNKIDGEKKWYDWTLAGSAACLCLSCMALVVWQFSKKKSGGGNINI